MRIVQSLLLVVFATWHLGAAGAARVIDVVGHAERAAARGALPLALFESLAPRERLLLQAGASVTVIFDDSGRQFLLLGPGRWEVGADAIATVTAATPDAMLVEADLETRRGDVAWEIHTGSGADRQRIFVNAVTGAVM